jgi:hypothetical protein
MNAELSKKENLPYRTLLALVLIGLAAALRIAPHPWNFTPVGAMALFSGAVLKDRRLSFVFPLLALAAGDLFIGFHKLIPIVYASFFISVAIGLCLRRSRTIARISLATLLGSVGLPLFWNTLAGDTLYLAVFFLGYGLAENFFLTRRERAPAIFEVVSTGEKR